VSEPDDDAIIMFEYQVDLVIWFRSDRLAGGDGYTDGERWFKAGDYDDAPVTWQGVLDSEPDKQPVLLVRAS
jgi:hypothetical protein